MDKLTIDTYDKNSSFYADKFAGVGSRIDCIEKTFAAWGGKNPRVLEIGCGDGRDAVEICKRTKHYLGIDASKGMIELAMAKVPHGNFRNAYMENYDFGRDLDIIFAFASLLHVSKEVFEQILTSSKSALGENGIFFMSLKEGDYNGAQVVSDNSGDRNFYYYREADIIEMAEGFECLSVERLVAGHTNWLNIMLRRK